MAATVENPTVLSKDAAIPNSAEISTVKGNREDSLTKDSTSVPTSELVVVETPDDCAICLDEVEPRGKLPIINPGCGHSFHFACLSKSVRRGHVECPCCRAPLPLDVIRVGYTLRSPRSSPTLARGVVHELIEAGVAGAEAGLVGGESIPAGIRHGSRATVSPTGATRGPLGYGNAFGSEIPAVGPSRPNGHGRTRRSEPTGAAPDVPRVRAARRRLFPDSPQAEATLENLYAFAEANRNIYSDFAQFIEAARSRQPNQPNFPLGRYWPAASTSNLGQSASNVVNSGPSTTNNEAEIFPRNSPLRRPTGTSAQFQRPEPNPRFDYIFQPRGASSHSFPSTANVDGSNANSSAPHQFTQFWRSTPSSISTGVHGFPAGGSTSSSMPTGVHGFPAGGSTSTHHPFHGTNGSNLPNCSFSHLLRGQQEGDPSVNYIFPPNPTDVPSQQTWNNGGAANSDADTSFAPADPSSSGSGFRFNLETPVASGGSAGGILPRFIFGDAAAGSSSTSGVPSLFSTSAAGVNNAPPLFSSTRTGTSSMPPLFSTANSVPNNENPIFSTTTSATRNGPFLISSAHRGSNSTGNAPINSSFQWQPLNAGSSSNPFAFGNFSDSMGRSTGLAAESFSAGSSSSQGWEWGESSGSTEGNSSSRDETSPPQPSNFTELPAFSFGSAAPPPASSFGNTLRRSPAFVSTIHMMNAPTPNFTGFGNDGSGQATPSFLFPAFTPSQPGPSFGGNTPGGPSSFRFSFDSPVTTPPNAPQIPPWAINAEAIQAAQGNELWNQFGLGRQDIHIVQQQQQQKQQEQRVEQQPENNQQRSPINGFQLPPMLGGWDPARSAWEDNSTW
ncbi:hypothetical protein BJ742DRAFT_777146 [Cladochytrium replicatum]|nr:hypothetical protein BJ742DRAFT_777146 [Cladochytrium replicatum]